MCAYIRYLSQKFTEISHYLIDSTQKINVKTAYSSPTNLALN